MRSPLWGAVTLPLRALTTGVTCPQALPQVPGQHGACPPSTFGFPPGLCPPPPGRPCPLLVLTITDREGSRHSLVALELARTLGVTVAGALFTCSWIIHLFACSLIQQAAREPLPVLGINQGPALLFRLSQRQGRQMPESLSPCLGGIPGGNHRDVFLTLRGGDLEGASEQLCADPWTTPGCPPHQDPVCPWETSFLSPGRGPAHPRSHSGGAVGGC